MNHLNSILLEGNVTESPRRISEKEDSPVRFSIASDRFSAKGEGQWEKHTFYMSVIARGGIADEVMEKITKGQLVRVVGRIRPSQWTGKDGKEHDTFEILAQHIELKGKKAHQEIKEEASIEKEQD